MEQTRQIRFLIPPFFLFLSLLWGLYWSDTCHNNWNDFMETDLIVYIGIAIASAIPLGYLIGTISILFLKIGFSIIPSEHSYECGVSFECLDTIREKTGISLEENESNRKRRNLFTIVTFDHGLLYNHGKGIHEWIMRRWIAFNIAINSITALISGFVIGLVLFDIKCSCQWSLFTLILIIALSIVGFLAWKETMEMIEFQSELI